MSVALYRHYDVDGDLLYVGISVKPLSRSTTHVNGSPWADEITRIEIERYKDRETAEKAEVCAIHNERPRHNTKHRSKENLLYDMPEPEAKYTFDKSGKLDDLVEKLRKWAFTRGLNARGLGLFIECDLGRIESILSGEKMPDVVERAKIDRLTAGHVPASGWK